jgi:hypothetical protein
MVIASYDKDKNDKEADNSDEELIATAERDFKRRDRQPANHFEKLLEVTCSNPAYPVRHKLKECAMMKNYMTTGAFTKGKKPEGDPVGKVVVPFPEEKAVMLIYGGPAPHESRCKLKLTSWVVIAVCLAALEYLYWFEYSITFDRMDHPDSIPKSARFPLIVDLLVGMTRLTKALVEGGSGLNLMYLNTFDGLGLT